jgi:Ni2+-binding GTPase involved in maturation of urease and hydrogenase
MNADYRQGLLDAVTEIEAELECVELEYADSPPCKNAAFRALTNSKQLILDRLAIESVGNLVGK